MKERIKEIIIEVLTQRGENVSFAEIERILERKGISYLGITAFICQVIKT
jgi:hypothetical protein